MAKLGYDKRPAVVRVRTMPKGEEIVALCERHHWKVIVGIEPDQGKGDISIFAGKGTFLLCLDRTRILLDLGLTSGYTCQANKKRIPLWRTT